MRNRLHAWAAGVALAAAASLSSHANAQIDVGGAADAAGDVGGSVDTGGASGDVGGAADVGGSGNVEAPQPEAPRAPQAETPQPSDIPEPNTEDLTDGAIQQGDRAVEDTQEAIDDTTDRAQDTTDDALDRAEDTTDNALDRAEDTADEALEDTEDFAEDTMDEADQFADDATREGEEAMQSFDELDADAQAELRQDAEFNDEINQQISSDIGLDVDAESSDEGLTVSNVAESSLAAQAGLRRGDVIVSLDGRSFNSYRGFNEYMWRNGYNRVPIVVLRNGQRQTIWWDSYPNRWNNYFMGPGYGYGQRDGRAGGYAQQGPHAGLGVRVVDGDRRQGGVFVQAVHESSPAEQAGVQPGDTILSINGRSYGDATQFVRAISQMDPNSSVRLVVMRQGGQQTRLTAQLSTREQALSGGYDQQQLASQQDQNERQRVLRPEYREEGQQQHQSDDDSQQRIEELEQQVRDLERQLQERE